MITSTYDAEHLHQAFGIDLGDIDMGAVESLGVGANWGRVSPGQHSDPHQHDETETFVILSGTGDLVMDGKRMLVRPGMVLQFEPFETHYLDNTSDADLLFATFYWRDSPRAARRAPEPGRRRFGERPVFVFSTPPTPNGTLHIGHLSGPYLGTDVYVRYQRMRGTRVWHLAATDDFQSYVAECARREGSSPQQVAQHYAGEIAAALALMDIVPDQVTHTSRDERYPQALRDFFTRLVASGKVTPQSGSALFDAETGQYLYEPYVSGKCPTCGSRAGGNICEECGEPNSCTDLVEPASYRSADPPREDTIVRYTLPLHEMRAAVLEHHHVGRAPAKLRELAHRVFSRDRIDVALSHPSEWGVRPDQPDLPGQVIWVWIELAFCFIYGIESLGRTLGTGWRADAPDGDWKIVHFLGYDNTFYHSILGPALYKLASPEWIPDVDYHVNEFYLLDGEKFSTSRRHAIWGRELLTPQTVDAARYYLAKTRPETSRTNFTLAGYQAAVQEILVGTWQRWLNDLGERVGQRYGGTVPDAGIWTPEHTAYLARLEGRLAQLAGCLGQDGFSLNRAAEVLDGIVTDALAFSAAEQAVAGMPDWADESRTAIALELAAARLLACCAAPVMPRFAGRLAAALGVPEPDQWPELVALVPPGTRCGLAGQVYFGAAEPEPDPPLLGWLTGLVRQTLRLADDEQVANATLIGLGAESLQAIALQYQILERTGAEVPVDDLLGDKTVTQLAVSLAAAGMEEGAVLA
ncbi:MAG TPA: class I tRNA ligase family protein [Streptosporangiaceae bacterium]|jgi:methionyl-tRNA synthetase